MAYQPYPVVPFKYGLNIDDEGFLLPPDGFTEFNGGHIQHGHIEKRAGYTLIASLSNALPVMGLFTYYDNTNVQTLIAFDTTSGYTFSPIPPYSFTIFPASDPIFTSSSTDFVWATNWQASNLTNRLYFSNGKADSRTGTDGIWYYDGTLATQLTRPASTDNDLGSTSRKLSGAKLLFVLKQRLICLNTYEWDGGNTQQHPQRMRWCQAQGPSNWDDIIPGGGGFVDAPTGEHIISGRALQNGIIVFFTNSVWVIEPTTDPALPFRWKKINDFRACDSKMGTVGYDRYVAALGKRGVTATDGIETRRIDDKIQAFSTNYVNQDSWDHVYCARSYAEKRFWTLYPKQEDTNSSGALIYEDESSSWSFYDIDMNVLGYMDNGHDWKYSDFTDANKHDWNYQEAGELTYDSFFWQGNSEYFIGGDTSGDVFMLENDSNDNGASISFSLKTGNWNPNQDQGIECQLGYVDFLVDTNKTTKFTVEFYKDNDADFYQSQQLDCLPDLGFLCEITAITRASPGVVTSYQHGLTTADVVYIYEVEGMDEVNTGPFTITVIDDDTFSIGVNTSSYGIYTGDGMVFQRKFYRGKAWKRAYGGGIGYLHQWKVTSSGINRPFTIYEYKPWFRPRGGRTLG